MTWVRLEDRFPWHRKVRPLSDAAFRLHVSGVCWATEHLTDGFVPASDLHLVSDVRTPKRIVNELEQRDIWDAVEGGWQIHDYLTYNLSAERVLADRAAAADRQRKAREAAKSRRESQEESRRDSRLGHAVVTVPPTRPDPTRPQQSPSDSPPVAALPDRFVDFWEVYPRRVGKGQAVKAWKTATRKADPDVIIAAALSFAAAQQGKDPQYVAHPSTWLTGERWSDETVTHLRVVGDSWFPGKGGSWDV